MSAQLKHKSQMEWGSYNCQRLLMKLGEQKLKEDCSISRLVTESAALVLKPVHFEFFCCIFDARCDDLPLGMRLTHIYLRGEPHEYAEARLELLRCGSHPFFGVIEGSSGKAGHPAKSQMNRCKERSLPVRQIHAMALFVWDKLSFLKGFDKRLAFSLIMCVLECRLFIKWVSAAATSGTLPTKWMPHRFVQTDLAFDAKCVFNRNSLKMPSQQVLNRFANPAGIVYCIPLYSRVAGRFLSVKQHGIEFLDGLPAYFVKQASNKWSLYLSDVRCSEAQYVYGESGQASKSQKKIMDKALEHATIALLDETEGPNILKKFISERFVSVSTERLGMSEQKDFFDVLLNLFDYKLQELFCNPQTFFLEAMNQNEREFVLRAIDVLIETLNAFSERSFFTPGQNLGQLPLPEGRGL